MFKKILLTLLGVTLLTLAPMPALAQEARELADDSTVIQEDLQQLYQDVTKELDDNGYMYMQDEPTDSTIDYNYDSEFNYDELTPDQQAALESLGILGAGAMVLVFIVSGVIALLSYVFMAVAYMRIAKKLGMDNAWWAWVPVLNMILMAQMGDINPWTLLLVLVPVVNVFYLIYFMIVSSMKTAEKLGLDKFLGLLVLVPLVQYFFIGYMAWGKFESKKVEVTQTQPVETVPTEVKE